MAEEEEESVPSSFFASLAMPFVAFAGFGILDCLGRATIG